MMEYVANYSVQEEADVGVTQDFCFSSKFYLVLMQCTGESDFGNFVLLVNKMGEKSLKLSTMLAIPLGTAILLKIEE